MGIRSTKNRLDGKSSLLITTRRTGGGTNAPTPIPPAAYVTSNLLMYVMLQIHLLILEVEQLGVT